MIHCDDSNYCSETYYVCFSQRRNKVIGYGSGGGKSLHTTKSICTDTLVNGNFYPPVDSNNTESNCIRIKSNCE